MIYTLVYTLCDIFSCENIEKLAGKDKGCIPPALYMKGGNHPPETCDGRAVDRRYKNKSVIKLHPRACQLILETDRQINEHMIWWRRCHVWGEYAFLWGDTHYPAGGQSVARWGVKGDTLLSPHWQQTLVKICLNGLLCSEYTLAFNDKL